MSGNEDYDLDWATFDDDTLNDVVVRASSISTIQTNMDLIKNNLDNITHDSSHLGDNRATHYTDHYDAHDNLQKTTEYTDHDTTEKTDHRITHYADHRTSQRSAHYGTRYSSNDSTDYSDYRVGVDVAYYVDKDSGHNQHYGSRSYKCSTHYESYNETVHSTQQLSVNRNE
jgi:hypothetical protein